MGRCEGYYRVENRRCDRDGVREIQADDGGRYAVCAYHAGQPRSTSVARWSGESGIRRSAPTGLASARAEAA